MTSSTIAVLSSLVMAALTAQQAGADTSVNMQVHSSLPISCHAAVVSSTIVSTSPVLTIAAQVQQSCNTHHDLAVTFVGVTGIVPSKLSIKFDGVVATVKQANAQVFPNLAPTDSVKSLDIVYSSGTAAQRQQLAATWGLTISPR
jgi:archaellum component FlaF (FlaF/FlaG flagellin family)